MTDLPPPGTHERLIESVPIMLGRLDAQGVVSETEGSVPNEEELGLLTAGKSNFFEIFPDFEGEILAALGGRQRRFTVHQSEGDEGSSHFEVQLIFDHRKGAGAYFLIHDVTEVHQLQLSVLECTDREQRRIGQDLHDTIGQELTGIRFLAENVRNLAAKGKPFDAELQEVQGLLGRTLESTRRIAWQLSPQLAGERIVDAFERLAEHIRELFSVDCQFESEIDDPVEDDDVAYNLYRIAQEACTNAVRHAEPRSIRIKLSTGPRNVLEIRDDGKGIEIDEDEIRPGMGLAMMRFRANAIGGALRTSIPDEGGTLVTCRFANRRPPSVPDTSANGTCDECSIG